MAERTQKQKTTTGRPAQDEQHEPADTAAPTTASGDRLRAELDDLLDEIDDVLETNAEDFVKSYVQKGGE